MIVAKEVILNLAILLPPVRALARRRHSTGMNNDELLVQYTYGRLREHVDPTGKDVLELGPGQTPRLLQLAMQDGAKSATGLDVENYVSERWPAEVRASVYDGRRMPFDDHSFDVIWSNSCLEHVRHPALTVAEFARVLRPGGLMISSIDLRDHYHKDPALHAEHLRYPSWLWSAMTWNRSAYTNRLRWTDWERLLNCGPLRLRICEAEPSEVLRSVYTTHPARRRYTESEFVTVGLYVVADRV